MTAESLVINRNRLIAWQNEMYARPQQDGVLRLHVGSGHLHPPGYTNIDLYTPEADLKADARNLPYPDNSVDEISSHHMMEHLPQRHFVSTLKEWYRVLKPGGILDLGLPDLALCLKAFEVAPEDDKWNYRIYTIYGNQVDTTLSPNDELAVTDEGQFHKSGVTAERLRSLLNEIGFDIQESYNYDGWSTPSIWMLAKKRSGVRTELSVFEQDCVMGVFTNKTTYLDGLLSSVKKYLPHLPMMVKLQDGPINANMEALRQDFIASGKRYWLFLDDDIEFLNADIVHNTISNMVKYGWACANVHSSFDRGCLTRPYAETLNLIRPPAVRETGWATGYFILVDSYRVGHIQPDLDLPFPNTSIDTSYSVAIRHTGYHIGLSGDVVYHTRKDTVVDTAAIDITNAYLMKKWGQFYFDHCQYGGNVLEWQERSM